MELNSGQSDGVSGAGSPHVLPYVRAYASTRKTLAQAEHARTHPCARARMCIKMYMRNHLDCIRFTPHPPHPTAIPGTRDSVADSARAALRRSAAPAAPRQGGTGGDPALRPPSLIGKGTKIRCAREACASLPPTLCARMWARAAPRRGRTTAS